MSGLYSSYICFASTFHSGIWKIIVPRIKPKDAHVVNCYSDFLGGNTLLLLSSPITGLKQHKRLAPQLVAETNVAQWEPQPPGCLGAHPGASDGSDGARSPGTDTGDHLPGPGLCGNRAVMDSDGADDHSSNESN